LRANRQGRVETVRPLRPALHAKAKQLTLLLGVLHVAGLSIEVGMAKPPTPESIAADLMATERVFIVLRTDTDWRRVVAVGTAQYTRLGAKDSVGRSAVDRRVPGPNNCWAQHRQGIRLQAVVLALPPQPAGPSYWIATPFVARRETIATTTADFRAHFICRGGVLSGGLRKCVACSKRYAI
jgi:hypothetical protein